MPSCQCSLVDGAENGSLATFARIREACPALREILVPDYIWPEYQQFCSADPDEAHHAPVAYLALKRRNLRTLTEPIHLFCLDRGELHSSLTNQYKKDLVERWMLKDDVKQRFTLAKIFQGRIVELLFAAALHGEGWRIEGLEALGDEADVAATDRAGRTFAFEVKYLGKGEILFELEVDAFSKGHSLGWLPVYSPLDYLQFRIFQAAKQLVTSVHRKIVVAVIADYDTYFATRLSEHWIDWRNPEFFRREPDIEPFLKKQYTSNPDLNHEMKHYISQIDEIWFYDMVDGLTLRGRQVDGVRC